jgi:RNA polymerase sigma-70 factor, ECF subfamily
MSRSATPSPTNLTHLTDWDLITAAQTGNTDAFGVLYTRHYDRVFRHVLSVTHTRDLAEDLTADTFVRLLRTLPRVRNTGHEFPALLLTISRNLIKDHYKSSRIRRVTTGDHTCDPPFVTLPTQEIPVDEHVLTHVLTADQRRVILASFQSLTAAQRDCVLLRFYHDYSITEVAGVMGRNEGAIKALQHRAVRKLTELLTSHREALCA